MDGKKFVEEIIQNGGKVYLVGGVVRDILYNSVFKKNKHTKDRDILVAGMAESPLVKILEKHGRVSKVGQSFGVIKFKMDGWELDIALPRTEVSTGPGYKDFIIKTDPFIPIKDDLMRRDSTINAMAYEVHSLSELFTDKIDENKLIDPFEGFQDLKSGVWRAVGDPHRRFLEDATRIMRGIRQCAELTFSLESDTQKCIEEHYTLLTTVIKQAPVRISDELVRILSAPGIMEAIKFMEKVKIASLLELKLDSTIINALAYCNTQNYPVHIKMAILLQGNNDWVRKFQLSAAPHFSKRHIKYLECVENNLKLVATINNDVAMRKFIQKCFKYIDDVYDVLLLYICLQEKLKPEHKLLLQLYDNNKMIIRTSSHLELNGVMILEMCKRELSGKEIGEVKKLLFDEITEGRVKNNVNELKEYFSSNKLFLNYRCESSNK